ncbi:MAG: anthranilate synthase component I [Phycisphaerae bacterium]
MSIDLQTLPEFSQFSAMLKPGAVVPVYVRLMADHLTPVTAYKLISEASPHAFLLESVVGGERVARYSFLGADPQAVLTAFGHDITIEDAAGKRQSKSPDPIADVEKLLGPHRSPKIPGLPAFTGGIVGYAGYDTVRYLEGEKLSDPPPDVRHLPDVLFGLYHELVVFDHVNKTVLVVANVRADASDRRTPAELYADAARRIEKLVAKLNRPIAAHAQVIPKTPPSAPPYRSNFKPAEFEAAVEKARQYIAAGDIFQVVLSQCLELSTRADPFDIYRSLRMINPSPFMFYIKSPHCILVGSSPEIMCRVENGIVTNRPLAGTRRRGATPEQDAALERELLADPKEIAEHVMLVDLGRNDVGRVAELGSVQVSDALTVERYSHVMHITTNVSGRLAADKTCFDALRNTLPVGTVSGAPKIRAMQIIDELEPTRRGPYAGAVGHFDFSGNMDTCIALRTMVITKNLSESGHTVFVQAGAGLVADSVPANEYQESLSKAEALLKAVAMAEAGM